MARSYWSNTSARPLQVYLITFDDQVLIMQCDGHVNGHIAHCVLMLNVSTSGHLLQRPTTVSFVLLQHNGTDVLLAADDDRRRALANVTAHVASANECTAASVKYR